MGQQEFSWFFALFHHEFRRGNRIAFESLMALAFAHFFGFGSVSKVEMATPIALIYKVLFPSMSTFETPPSVE